MTSERNQRVRDCITQQARLNSVSLDWLQEVVPVLEVCKMINGYVGILFRAKFLQQVKNRIASYPQGRGRRSVAVYAADLIDTLHLGFTFHELYFQLSRSLELDKRFMTPVST